MRKKKKIKKSISLNINSCSLYEVMNHFFFFLGFLHCSFSSVSMVEISDECVLEIKCSSLEKRAPHFQLRAINRTSLDRNSQCGNGGTLLQIKELDQVSRVEAQSATGKMRKPDGMHFRVCGRIQDELEKLGKK